MYGYTWTNKNGIFRLSVEERIKTELRPVFKEEIALWGLDKFLKVKGDADSPYLWAESGRRYIVNGKCVAEASGGGFYSAPKITFNVQKSIQLNPVDIDSLWSINEPLMEGLVQKAIAFVREVYEEYADKGYKFVVAFSGGKDSLVLLDIVQRALSPDQFVVIFGDTGMEFKDTYAAVDKAMAHYQNLNFKTARSIYSANESWKEFGPPGRRLRWCCAVHKSVPTLLLLKEMCGGKNVRAIVFDGVRKEESEKRAKYKEIAEGKKHVNQVNVRPILEWSAAELYLYLLKREILFNRAYFYGMSRVGCAVCPMSAGWRDSISAKIYPDDIHPFLSVVEDFAMRNKGKGEAKTYIEKIKWGARMGGTGMPNAHTHVFESSTDTSITFLIPEPLQEWLDVAQILGPIVERDKNELEQNIRGQIYRLSLSRDDKGAIEVTYASDKPIFTDRYAVSWMRGIANKVAYCVGCQTCMCECPTGAFQIDENKKIHIISSKCVHCARCMTDLNKACWRAFSLSLPKKGTTMYKGMDRYKGFGLRVGFIEQYLQDPTGCWSKKDGLGNLQYESLRTWLRDARVIDPSAKGNTPTELTPILASLTSLNPLAWAVMWVNLAQASPLVRWYLFEVPVGEALDRNDLMSFIDDQDCPAERTKSNAVGTITDTMNNSPLGAGLELGIPLSLGKTKKYLKQGWSTPDPWALLYAMYVYAERIGNHHDFTVRELVSIGRDKKNDLPAVDPITVFALNPDTVKDTFQDLANQYPQYMKVSFVAGLDNIQLDPKVTSLDILKAAVKEA